MPGSEIVLAALPYHFRPDSVATTLAHEIGHSLGLDHTLSLSGQPADALPLPYVGIGGEGYQGAGPLPTFHSATGTSDLMGYTTVGSRWTSPATWWRMHQAILGQATSRPARDSARAESAASRGMRRFVTGYLDGKHAAIFSSTVINASVPTEPGPVAGRLVALNQHGNAIVTATITEQHSTTPTRTKSTRSCWRFPTPRTSRRWRCFPSEAPNR